MGAWCRAVQWWIWLWTCLPDCVWTSQTEAEVELGLRQWLRRILNPTVTSHWTVTQDGFKTGDLVTESLDCKEKKNRVWDTRSHATEIFESKKSHREVLQNSLPDVEGCRLLVSLTLGYWWDSWAHNLKWKYRRWENKSKKWERTVPRRNRHERGGRRREEERPAHFCLFLSKGHAYLLSVISCSDKVMTLKGGGIITKTEPQGSQEGGCSEQK